MDIYLSMIKNWLKKERKQILFSLCMGFLLTSFVSLLITTKTYSENIQNSIAEKVVRFHVIANSDSDEDQALKLLVRDSVLELMSEPLNNSNDINETKKILIEYKDEIKNKAMEVIVDNGFGYSVEVNLTTENFPAKVYGDIAFPAGEYDALKIEIGEASGQNWWCVMFPPLCFVDVSCDTVSEESKTRLKNVLAEEEYTIIANPSDEIIPVIKFKIVDWWQEKTNF